MEKESVIKIVSLVAVVVLVANLVLFAALRYNALAFWLIITLVAIIAFPLLKWLKQK